ncbi:sulfatase-like hydrolase/transferase [Bremerella sp.]|uniref:sulfatase-like hydrolase/transferase n=1 Tax=Bremerella sp. TaxID=2795602 RepID=UPI003919CA6A
MKFIPTLIIVLGSLWSFLPEMGLAAEKPNILIIMTDDQRADTIGALGNAHIQTPNLDKLAERSLVFSNGYCYGAHTAAVCIASRNQLMTGYVWHRWAPKKFCAADGETLPRVMKAAGYETFYREKSGRSNHPEILNQFDESKSVDSVQALMSGRACKTFVDDALHFLKHQRNTKKPFCMYLGVAGPHDPRFAEKRFRDLYELKDIPLPENFKPLHHWDIGSMTIRDERLEEWPREAEATRTHILDYFALITAMDHDLGRLLDYLEESGLNDNTIVLFTSDHGLALGSHGLFGKQNVYEVGMKVPFMVAGPDIKPGKTEALVYLHDIFPTVADYGGAILREQHDGLSLRIVIQRETESVRDVLTLAYQGSQRSIRDNQWKLMVFPQINKLQLFDLHHDPGETKDVAAKHPEQVTRLWEKLVEQQSLLGDKQPLVVDQPKEAAFTIPIGVTVFPRERVGGESQFHTED